MIGVASREEVRRAVDDVMRELPNTRAWAERLVWALSSPGISRRAAAGYLRLLADRFLDAAQRLDDADDAEQQAIDCARRACATVGLLERGST